jgi:hypothetical protein
MVAIGTVTPVRFRASRDFLRRTLFTWVGRSKWVCGLGDYRLATQVVLPRANAG